MRGRFEEKPCPLHFDHIPDQAIRRFAAPGKNCTRPGIAAPRTAAFKRTKTMHQQILFPAGFYAVCPGKPVEFIDHAA